MTTAPHPEKPRGKIEEKQGKALPLARSAPQGFVALRAPGLTPALAPPPREGAGRNPPGKSKWRMTITDQTSVTVRRGKRGPLLGARSCEPGWNGLAPRRLQNNTPAERGPTRAWHISPRCDNGVGRTPARHGLSNGRRGARPMSALSRRAPTCRFISSRFLDVAQGAPGSPVASSGTPIRRTMERKGLKRWRTFNHNSSSGAMAVGT
jgi:hypothetical protein